MQKIRIFFFIVWSMRNRGTKSRKKRICRKNCNHFNQILNEGSDNKTACHAFSQKKIACCKKRVVTLILQPKQQRRGRAEPAFKLFPAFWEVLISKLFRILFSPCACLQPAPQHHSHAAAIIENIII